MTQSAKAQEPSMEEILASIRRIIADDDANKSAPKPPEAVVPPSPPPLPAPPPAAVAPRPAPPPPKPPAPLQKQDDIDAVLAEIESKAPPKPTPKPAPKPAAPPADVLDLTEAMAAPAQSPNFRTIDGNSDVVFTDRAEDTEAPLPPPPRVAEEPRRAPPPRPAPPVPSDRALLSNSTSAAVDAAFNTLAHTMLLNNARTLDDLVKDMLRPMLKNWLDDNLPGLVERIVRAEIERVSRGRP